MASRASGTAAGIGCPIGSLWKAIQATTGSVIDRLRRFGIVGKFLRSLGVNGARNGFVGPGYPSILPVSASRTDDERPSLPQQEHLNYVHPSGPSHGGHNVRLHEESPRFMTIYNNGAQGFSFRVCEGELSYLTAAAASRLKLAPVTGSRHILSCMVRLGPDRQIRKVWKTQFEVITDNAINADVAIGGAPWLISNEKTGRSNDEAELVDISGSSEGCPSLSPLHNHQILTEDEVQPLLQLGRPSSRDTITPAFVECALQLAASHNHFCEGMKQCLQNPAAVKGLIECHRGVIDYTKTVGFHLQNMMHSPPNTMAGPVEGSR